jgi:hypothetical protein
MSGFLWQVTSLFRHRVGGQRGSFIVVIREEGINGEKGMRRRFRHGVVASGPVGVEEAMREGMRVGQERKGEWFTPHLSGKPLDLRRSAAENG